MKLLRANAPRQPRSQGFLLIVPLLLQAMSWRGP